MALPVLLENYSTSGLACALSELAGSRPERPWLTLTSKELPLRGLADWANCTSYYKYLAPLTPVSHPDLRTLESNPGILSEEPVLTVTLLTISSRYMHLTGAGSQTRSMMVHERLWKYLQNMVTRMFWGQEQFGGGFCGAGGRKRASKGTERGRLRTVGTVERYVKSTIRDLTIRR